MKEFFQNAIDTLKDDRTSWKFKLCNILTNDWLRWELACTLASVNEIKDMIDIHKEHDWSETGYKHFVNCADRHTKRAIDHIKTIWRI